MATSDLICKLEKRARAVWRNMRFRCESEKSIGWKDYGERGIKVCEEWKIFETFWRWAKETGYRLVLQLDRKENSGPYAPWNCRWTTAIVNANNKRNNRIVRAFGETKTIAEWTRDDRCKVGGFVVSMRLDRLGWEPEKAIATQSLCEGWTAISAFGETKTIAQWSRDFRCCVKYHTLKRRLLMGTEPEKAITEPVRKP